MRFPVCSVKSVYCVVMDQAEWFTGVYETNSDRETVSIGNHMNLWVVCAKYPHLGSLAKSPPPSLFDL